MKIYWTINSKGKAQRFIWVEGLTGRAKKSMYKRRRKLLAEHNLFEDKP